MKRVKNVKQIGVRQSLLLAGLILASVAGSAQAVTFYAYASTSGNPGLGGYHIYSDSGPTPVEISSDHSGLRNRQHVNDLGASSAMVDAQAFARADMNGLHLETVVTGSLRDPEPYYSETFAGSANARAALGDSFVIGFPGSAAVFATTSMTLHFNMSGPLSAYAYATPDPLYPLNAGGSEGRSRWHADFVARDTTTGNELGRITLDQSCSMSTTYNFSCFGDLPGNYVMNISVPFGHTLSISLNGETWSSVLGAASRGGDILAGGQADLRHTIAWGGITNVRDENGQAISGFTAISATSGYDYVNAFPAAVPEPETYATMLAGLGLVGFAARRRAAL
ncbi:PEPxxWA-CTERM sorting domain-containing protein [Thiobacillus sp.]|uniref:PEPxxWA-CTERM sorting domain-containing protein n=1 Tax=Thiobacillus sp. TaxID=924 RepID=UPI0025F9A41E|nr:PEPxxWA-CTERM sorting domain-containing protein [Thiobacillus sp.]